MYGHDYIYRYTYTWRKTSVKVRKYKLHCHIFHFINLSTKNREMPLAKDTFFPHAL